MLTSRDLRRRGDRPLLMGILNVTPDSFSDGGRFCSVESAVRRAFELADEGADIIDIGGESTRPGADPVSADEELGRLAPVLKDIMPSIGVPVSVDTMKSSVACECVRLGAGIINDVSGLRDPRMASVVADLNVPVVVMSSYGDPSTFRTRVVPGDAVSYMKSELVRITELALSAGVHEDMIVTDPGVGFGTSDEQGESLVDSASEFSLGRFPVLIGPSRKRFLAHCYPGEDPDAATAKMCLRASEAGADVLRVHAPAVIKTALDNA